MSRALPLLAALLFAAPATAATYVGKPAVQASEPKIVARDIVWNNVGGTFYGKTEESRPVVLCQSLAKKAGHLESFTVNGQALADADLAKCNAVAPQLAAPSLAEAH